ncbi:DnaJ domain protein [Aspergillus bombycis]|uniref:DnaJ domain protein n=1 Tax=Aspergillus bombycis TaxID=109264 RepID=A0A1F8A0L9_9EURO|nr:DnaJ domain protein [Aspergillus bombycis]OGM44858.1 DnaJ domain protein [Aspergillus bombycis]
MPHEDDVPDIPEEAPLETDLYETLGVQGDATADQIKSAYRKLALKHHPDKAPEDQKQEANKKFQQIAFAYAILSDERRRRRFDLTGSTAEAVDEDDDFNWTDFYREQFSSAIDVKALDKFKQEYQGSEEEESDLLAAFEKYRGDMDKIYESVMLCNVLDDDERFRALIDKAIADGKVEKYKKYSEEPERKRQQRFKRAQKEAKEAEEAAKELEEKEEVKGTTKAKKGKKKKTSAMDDSDLVALIQQRQASRAESFFDKLEAKYAPGKKRGAKFEEPPEEAFEATAARRSSKKKRAT